MDWISLNSSAQLADIKEKSKNKAQLIFKHSSRCSISSMAKNRLERETPPENVDFYYLDLISYRELSAKIAEEFSVFHESPQVILIKNGECSYDESHSGINMDDIIEQAAL
jgi:bacillithiol system protein YtxJ